MPDIRLITLDLDGTLLNSQKELSGRSREVLFAAAEKGIEIVPATGRFFSGMPASIRELPFLHYAITINGAQVYDIVHDRVISRTEIPYQRGVEIMSYLDTLPVIYDCYMDNRGWMSRSLWEQAYDFIPDAHYAQMVHDLRQPVKELKDFLLERQQDVQKIQFFCREAALHKRLLKELTEHLPDIAVSTAIFCNIEMNHRDAHKGRALCQLADYLDLSLSQTAAFGDGLNDLSMIQQAGVGVAMANAAPEVLASADAITADCDHHGVAQYIESYIL